ncbi:hypothetical protein NEOC65_001371 [Neochlamydia sp. AcF65]|nr:hypothetical protein [Neochlamydia sp. AcF65]MBS4170108.1 hypothetical protein [Neochlamydia sp. AcF95]
MLFSSFLCKHILNNKLFKERANLLKAHLFFRLCRQSSLNSRISRSPLSYTKKKPSLPLLSNFSMQSSTLLSTRKSEKKKANNLFEWGSCLFRVNKKS